MQGFQVTFHTEQNRRHGHHLVTDWLMELAQSLGIQGVTTSAGTLGVGRDGKLHSAHFIELSDQPVAVTMALTAPQCTLLFDRLALENANLFYVKTAVEFGVVGNVSAH